MVTEDGSPCRRLSSICDESDVDFSAFHFLASNALDLPANVADSNLIDPTAFLQHDGAAVEVNPDEKQGESPAGAESVDDALNALRADSSDPLLFTDGLNLPAATLANSPPAPLHGHHASPRPVRPSSASSTPAPFPDMAIETEDVVAAQLSDYAHFDPAHPLQAVHDPHAIGRRRSQSVPPNDMSFHRQLVTGNKLHIGTPPGGARPKHRATASFHKVPHPYASALLKRQHDGRPVAQPAPSRAMTATQQQQQQQMFRAHGSPPYSAPPVFDGTQQQAQQQAQQHREGGNVARRRMNAGPPSQAALHHQQQQLQHAAAIRRDALATARLLCGRTLARLGPMAEGVRQDAIMMGQDQELETFVFPFSPSLPLELETWD
jgi:hypothetical protein